MAIIAHKVLINKGQHIHRLSFGDVEKNDILAIMRAVVSIDPNATTAQNVIMALSDSVEHAAGGGQPR